MQRALAAWFWLTSTGGPSCATRRSPKTRLPTIDSVPPVSFLTVRLPLIVLPQIQTSFASFVTTVSPAILLPAVQPGPPSVSDPPVVATSRPILLPQRVALPNTVRLPPILTLLMCRVLPGLTVTLFITRVPATSVHVSPDGTTTSVPVPEYTPLQRVDAGYSREATCDDVCSIMFGSPTAQ